MGTHHKRDDDNMLNFLLGDRIQGGRVFEFVENTTEPSAPLTRL